MKKNNYERKLKSELFIESCLELVGSKYVWGGEKVGAVDCSGTLRYAYWKQCFNMNNYTADRFFKEVFTEPCTQEDEINPNVIKAIFYITRKPYEIPTGEIRPAGIARHVTPVVGTYVVLHADWNNGVELRTALSVRLMYEAKNCEAIWRKLP